MLAFNMETKEIIFLKDYWRADVGRYGEGRRNLRAPGIKGRSKYRAFWKGERCPPSRDPNAYTEKRELGMLVEGYGAPQPIQDVSGCRRSVFDFDQILTGVRKCNCRRYDG